jgi:phenylacetate-coenzyme A ligase PaaK-like adenylate-forming protein
MIKSQQAGRLNAIEVVFDTNDVVLAAITHSLNLDDLDQNSSQVFHMRRAYRNVYGLVLIHGLADHSEKVTTFIKNTIGISTQIRIVGPGTLERSLGKAKRVFDKRPKN